MKKLSISNINSKIKEKTIRKIILSVHGRCILETNDYDDNEGYKILSKIIHDKKIDEFKISDIEKIVLDIENKSRFYLYRYINKILYKFGKYKFGSDLYTIDEIDKIKKAWLLRNKIKNINKYLSKSSNLYRKSIKQSSTIIHGDFHKIEKSDINYSIKLINKKINHLNSIYVVPLPKKYKLFNLHEFNSSIKDTLYHINIGIINDKYYKVLIYEHCDGKNRLILILNKNSHLYKRYNKKSELFFERRGLYNKLEMLDYSVFKNIKNIKNKKHYDYVVYYH